MKKMNDEEKDKIVKELSLIRKSLVSIEKHISPDSQKIAKFALIFSFISLLIIAVPVSPRVFNSIDHEWRDGSCPMILPDYGKRLSFSLSNSGEDSSYVVISAKAKNVEIRPGNHVSLTNVEPLNGSYIYSFNLLPLDISEKYVENIHFKPINRSEIAFFEVKYSYDSYLFNILPYPKQTHSNILVKCSYYKPKEDKLNWHYIETPS